jgi:hypothetical protein
MRREEGCTFLAKGGYKLIFLAEYQAFKLFMNPGLKKNIPHKKSHTRISKLLKSHHTFAPAYTINVTTSYRNPSEDQAKN